MQTEEYITDCRNLWKKHTSASMAALIEHYKSSIDNSDTNIDMENLLPQFYLDPFPEPKLRELWDFCTKDSDSYLNSSELPKFLATVVEVQTG
jgi:hypothetical protein